MHRLVLFFLCSTVIAGDADLSLLTQTDPDPISLGQAVTYTLTVTNSGPDAANNVVVNQLLPMGALFTSADNGGVYDSNTGRITWNLAQIASGNQVTLTVVLTAELPPTNADLEVLFGGGAFSTLDPTLFQLTTQAQLINPIHAMVASHIPEGLTSGNAGLVYTNPGSSDLVDGQGAPIRDGQILRIEAGVPVVLSGGGLLVSPRSVVHDPEDQLLVADPFGLRDDGEGGVLPDQTGRILRIDPANGAQSILSEGDHLVAPRDLAFVADDLLLVADGSGKLIGIDVPSGSQSLLHSGGLLTDPRALAVAIDDTIYMADGNSGILTIDSHSYAPSVLMAPGVMNSPFDIAPAFNNQLFISDPGFGANGAIHDVDVQAGTVTTTWSGSDFGGVFEMPTSMVLTHFYISNADVSSDDNDPVPDNNNFPLASVLVPGMTAEPPDEAHIVENIGLSDVVTLTVAPMISVSESVGLSDSVTVTPAPQIVLSEAIGVADYIAVTPAPQIVLSETIGVLDTPQLGAFGGPPTIEDLRFYADLDFRDEGPTLDSMTRLHVVFSELMADPKGNQEPGDVTNPIHYLLIAPGEDGTFETVDCSGGVAASDVQITIDAVSSFPQAQAASLSFGEGFALPAGSYRLIVCGDLGLVDLEGLALDGDGDQEPGGNYLADFELGLTNLLINPNLDDDTSGWSLLPPDATSVLHDPEDANGSIGSGSLAIHDSGAENGAGEGTAIAQCVAVEDSNWYRFAGKVRQQRDNGSPVNLIARVDWYEGKNCEGGLLHSHRVPLQLSPQGYDWVKFDVAIPTPAGARSATVILGNPDGTSGTGILQWDALVFGKDPNLIFSDGFESGDLSRW